jgi:hypothetical protein
MINKIIKDTVSLFLAAIVLVATSGFTVFKHSCSTEQTIEYSLLAPDFSCQHIGSNEAEKLPACCCLPKVVTTESLDQQKCCDTDSYLVKMKINFETQDFNKKNLVEVECAPVNMELETRLFSAEFSHIIISDDLPPPLSGKALHIFLHQLNIPYPSV